MIVDPGGSTRRVNERVVVMPQYACGRCWYCDEGEHVYCHNQRDVLAESGNVSGLATYAEAMLKPAYLLLPVPNDVSLEHAALLGCALGPTFTACVKTRLHPTETVVISGCGPVGLGGVINATVRHTRVIVIEPDPYRRELARRLGAACVVDPTTVDPAEAVREVTLGVGADVAIECSGTRTGATTLAELLRPGGRLAIVAWGDIMLPSLPPLGLEIHGCWHWNHLLHLTAMWRIVRQAAPLLDQLVTHRFSLAQVAQAWDVQETGACGKVLLHP